MKRRPLVAFLSLVLLFSGGFIAAAMLLGRPGAWIAQLYMLAPALAAIVTRLFFYERGFRDACLRFGRWRDYPKFWALSVGIILLAYGMYTLLGAVTWDFSGETFLSRFAAQMSLEGKDIHDLPAGLTPRMMVAIFLAGGLTVFNIPGILMGFGEEFGWRGFLFPRLYEIRPWMGFMIGGVIWFAWHLPLLLVIPASMRPPTTPWSIAAGVAMALPASILAFTFFAYVYVKSRSIWVVSLAHITQNNAGMALSLVAPLDMTSVGGPLLANLGLLATMGGVIGLLHWKGELAVFAGRPPGFSSRDLRIPVNSFENLASNTEARSTRRQA